MPPDEMTKLVLNDLFGLWDKRAGDYGKVLFGVALVKLSGVWKNVLTFFLPLHKSRSDESPVDANYGDFRIARGLLALEEAKKVLRDLIETDSLCLPKLPKVPLTASMHPSLSIRFVTSAERGVPVQYPFAQFSFNVSDSSKANPPQSTLYSVNLPTYPRGDLAIENLLNVHLGDWGAYTGVLVALAPDYRARIAELRLSTKGLQVQIECLSEKSEESLIGKLYYETTEGRALTSDLLFDAGNARFDAVGFARHLVLGLVSKTDETLIDERVIYSAVRYRESGIILESDEQDIERLILAGESVELEFKRELPAKRVDFALAAAAVANGDGGRILIGVENNGENAGVSRISEETIANILRSHCEPAVEFRFEEVAIKGNAVIVVTIPPGKDKPYDVRDKGVYVRSGATTRAATRYELDRMYGERGPLFVSEESSPLRLSGKPRPHGRH